MEQKKLLIELSNSDDYQLVLSLIQRLHIKYQEVDTPTLSESAKRQAEFLALAGSLEDTDATELLKIIEDSRTSKNIDTSWATE